MRVVIVGQGYVGLPIAMKAVEVGHEVVGLEASSEKVSALTRGVSYVEDISDAALSDALSRGYVPTEDATLIKDFDVAIITVPTPLTDGAPDLSFVRDATATVSHHVTTGSTVVLESTTYPGTTTEVVVPILEKNSGLVAGQDFFVGYSPERIDPGNSTWNLYNTPKVVSGINPSSLRAVARFYGSIVERVVEVSSTDVAELTKLMENTFRHVNIALMNELAMFASDLGVSIWDALEAASTKPFGYMPFRPGPGVGGHCLPVDPSYLSWRVERRLGLPFRFVELANEVNGHMPDYVLRRVAASLNRRKLAMNGSRCVIIGASYKRNSGDAREAPGPILCSLLQRNGVDVRVVDPHIDARWLPSGVALEGLSVELLQSADLVVVITDHDKVDWSMIETHAVSVLDTCHRLPAGPSVEYL